MRVEILKKVPGYPKWKKGSIVTVTNSKAAELIKKKLAKPTEKAQPEDALVQDQYRKEQAEKTEKVEVTHKMDPSMSPDESTESTEQ